MEQPQFEEQVVTAEQLSSRPDIFECLAQRLHQEHGLADSSITNTEHDAEEGLPVLILDAHQDFQVTYSSVAFALATGWQKDAVLGKQGIDFLRLRPDASHDALNHQAWQELLNSQQSLSQHVAGTPCPDPATVLFLGTLASGVAFWSVMDIVPITPKSDCQCHYLALIFLPLDAPVPPAIFDDRAADNAVATALLEILRGDLVRARRELAEELRMEVARRLEENPASDVPQDMGVLNQAADEVRKEIMHIHEDAKEGDHYVPKLGWESVEAFEARPHETDVGALGRNCRFMQPNTQKINMRINRPELQRIDEFCQHGRGGHTLSLLLNERADGRHFWNLMYMKHALAEGSESGSQHGQYIFVMMTSITSQKDALDMLILQELGGAGSGAEAMQKLRDALREREEHWLPSESCTTSDIGEVSTAWIRDVGQSLDIFWEQGHFVPRIGTVSALNFSGMWPLTVDAYSSYLEDLLGAPADGRNSWRANRDPNLICTVADPLGMDC
eukprot:CAMPEP_0115334612 /NCGR_PEP_ID=MMETSP0270-20121206/88000_1 /TAXON_ID=71861 /ORGANISM="Scrippsiella trochoidea, Strain CCMP3099" /LENGTH=502 /DNA_ID=CAMNT_0002755599 /DNA_START=8 /DNA_END=1513 /DNA_ORIENTATION=+